MCVCVCVCVDQVIFSDVYTDGRPSDVAVEALYLDMEYIKQRKSDAERGGGGGGGGREEIKKERVVLP